MMAGLTQKGKWAGWLLMSVLFLFLAWGAAQQQQQQSQDIPDAPSTTRPPQPFPTTPPTSARPAPEPPQPNAPPGVPAAPRTVPSDQSDNPDQSVGDLPSSRDQSNATQPQPAKVPPPNTQPPPPPMPPVKTVPQGGATQDANGITTSAGDLYKITANVNFVLVPVTVKDQDGRLVAGLQSKDFVVLEDGGRQTLKFFTSDPFPLSAAVVLDLGMPDAAVQKVNLTFPALQGAFSAYDEVAVYTYSSTVSQQSGFGGATQKLAAVLNQLKTDRGRNNGPPVTSGPLASGPSVNGVPIDQPVQPVVTPPKESHVLNDAILAAARDLSKRDRARRKIIFVISDGREFGSTASYKDVLKVLLTNNIMVYAVGLEASAIPIYGKMQRFTHLPRYGYSDILPKYTNATGGEVFNELSSSDVELAYTAALGDARNQYTLGYTTRATPSSKYRVIDVRVRRADVKVYAKDGYYPLPPVR
jgi:VWFA-related protein